MIQQHILRRLLRRYNLIGPQLPRDPWHRRLVGALVVRTKTGQHS